MPGAPPPLWIPSPYQVQGRIPAGVTAGQWAVYLRAPFDRLRVLHGVVHPRSSREGDQMVQTGKIGYI